MSVRAAAVAQAYLATALALVGVLVHGAPSAAAAPDPPLPTPVATGDAPRPAGGASPAVAPDDGDPGWMRRAAGVTSATGWALWRFVGSGLWHADTSLVVEHDQRRSDTEVGTFAMARGTVRTNAAVRNSTLVLGPRTLVGNLGLDVALMRDGFVVDGVSSPGVGHVVGYDLGVTALPDRSYSFGVFATRAQTRSPRTFGTTREQRTSRWGALAQWRNPWLDTTIDWTQQTFQSEARTGPGLLRDGERRRTFSLVGTKHTGRHLVDIEHRRDDRVDLVFPDSSFPLETTRLRHALLFGRAVGGRSLVSTFSLNRRGGHTPRDYMRADARLDYRLRPALDTRTSYHLDRIDLASVTRTRHSADVRVQHRLYESLRTTVGVRGAAERVPDGQRTIVGGTLVFDYTKRVIGGGRLSAVVGRRYDRDDNRAGAREDVVLDEAHDARIGTPFRLRADRVIPGSIVLTDAAQSIVFVEGFDYRLDVIGDTVEVSILADGRIRDGQVVTVDYRVGVTPFTSIVTAQPQFDLALDYGWISPYLHLQRTDRTLLSGVDDGTTVDRMTRTFGVRVRGGGRRVSASWRAARRIDTSPRLAFTTTDVGQTTSWVLAPGRVVVVDLEQALTQFQVPTRDETRRSGRLDLRWQATPLLSCQLTALARVRDDSLGARETFAQAGLEATWAHRVFQTVASLGRDWGTRDGRGYGGVRMSVAVSRSF